MAEFGLPALVKIEAQGRTHSILFDTGVGKRALLQNAKALKIDLKQIECIVISHGHPDHTAATPEALSAIGKEDLPIMLHPCALRKTVMMLPNGERYGILSRRKAT